MNLVARFKQLKQVPLLNSNSFAKCAVGVGFVLVGLLGCNSREMVVEEIVAAKGAVSGNAIEFRSSDWPQWRGPGIDGAAANQVVPTQWDESQSVAWQSDVPGQGHGSPILIGDLVILATAIEKPEQKQLVVAYDRSTGERRWLKDVHVGGFASKKEIHHKATYANSTLASDGERVFAAFFNSGAIWLTALDLRGEQVWQTRVCPFKSKFGYAPSPVTYKSLVILAADHMGGGCLAGLDRESGELVWLKKRPAVSTYSSPLVAEIAGQDQLVISGCDQVSSHDPATGQLLWSCNAVTQATCGTVVTDGQNVFASGGFPDRQTVCIRGDGSGEIVWQNNARLYEPSLIYDQGNLFGVTDKGIAHCWDAANGEEKWKERLKGEFSASPVVCNGLIYVPNLNGQTFVFEADSESLKEIAVNDLGNNVYASPAIAGGDLVLRVGFGEAGGRKEKLICLRNADGVVTKAADTE